ncbi:glutamyl-tRNA reductase [Halobacteriaceae archaeon GCM10025711]
MNPGTGVVSGVRVSQDSATVDEIEAVRVNGQTAAVEHLLAHPDVDEAFVLQTCHRVEAYVVTSDPVSGRRALMDRLPLLTTDVSSVKMAHEESLRHLLRVAAGLESVVLGEDQILGQVRAAYEDASEAGGLGQILEDAVTKAIHVGERARTDTPINEGVTSMGSAARRLAARERDLDGATAVVVGAGEMGTLVAKAFADSEVARLVVANRTPSTAAHVVADISGDVETEAVSLDALGDVLVHADVVVAATSSQRPVVKAGDLAANDDVLVIDLGQPRDVSADALSLDVVTVFDLDDLEAVTDATKEQRRRAAEDVEAIIDRELDLLLDQYKRKRADEVIAAMYESAERLKRRELATAFSKLEARDELTDEQREVVSALADTLVSQMLAAPTRSLRDAAAQDDWTTINTALQLFNPEFEADSPFGAPPEEAAERADAVDEDD